MEEIKVKQQAKDEVTKNCMNIKEEIIEHIESPKLVEKVLKTIHNVIFVFKCNN